MNRQMDLFLIRHGESVSNLLPDYATVPIDESDYLTANGHRQATLLGQYFKKSFGLRGAHLRSSPLIRASQTSDVISGILGIPVTKDERLAERSIPKIDRYTTLDVKTIFDASHAYPNESRNQCETVFAHFDRVSKWIDGFVSDLEERPELIVCHGGTIDLMMLAFLQTGAEAVRSCFFRLDCGHFHHLRRHHIIFEGEFRNVIEVLRVNEAPIVKTGESN